MNPLSPVILPQFLLIEVKANNVPLMTEPILILIHGLQRIPVTAQRSPVNILHIMAVSIIGISAIITLDNLALLAPIVYCRFLPIFPFFSGIKLRSFSNPVHVCSFLDVFVSVSAFFI